MAYGHLNFHFAGRKREKTVSLEILKARQEWAFCSNAPLFLMLTVGYPNIILFWQQKQKTWSGCVESKDLIMFQLH